MDEATVKSLIKDLDKLADTIREVQEMCKVEKKEPRKLWEIIKDIPAYWLNEETYRSEAKAAIDAVMECYEDWRREYPSDYYGVFKKFPEYLKEKLL